ncbi:hypothetical protein [Acetobacter sp.]|uniref:cell division protein FtsL n=1 Tax=Acetobacter sp. TaxID=440 RepID=UPI0039EC123A
MFRPFTIFCAIMAGGSGMFLYTKKHQTTELDQHISKIVADTQHIRQQTAVLQTEWALLNQPERLNHLAARFDPNLKPMNPNQFVRLADLKQHLPSPDTRHLTPAPETAAAPQVVASRVTEPTHTEVEPERVTAPVAKQVLASANPVASPRPVQQIALAKTSSELPVQARVSETAHRIETHHAAEPLRVASEANPVAAPHKITHHPDALALALDDHAETPVVHHAAHPATPVALADSSATTHHATSRDVASLTDVSKTSRHLVVARNSVPSDIAKPHASSLTSAPVTVAAWHPATAPRYVEARAIYSGSLLGRSAIGGGLPPPMPVSN